MSSTKEVNRQIDRSIIAFALPALGQILASPVFVLFDTAIVGRLINTTALAGLAVASIIVAAISGVCIFASYVTNASVAAAFGAGSAKKAVKVGLDGVWLSVILGLIMAALLHFFAPTIVSWFGPEPNVAAEAVAYLRAANIGIPGILVIMATSGLLRGLKMYKYPMIVAIIGVFVNVGLNLLFIIPMNMGIMGSGLGTGITMLLEAFALLIPCYLAAKKHGASLRPSKSGLFDSMLEGLPVFIRSVILWASLCLFMAIITHLGENAVAGLQIIDSVFTLVVFLADAVAIALQTLIAVELGAGNYDQAKLILRRAFNLTFKIAILISIFLFSTAWLLPELFTADTNVQAFATFGLIEAGLIIFHANFAFTMDGAMIAGNDGRFMAISTSIAFVIYVPVAIALTRVVEATPLGLFIVLLSYDVLFLGLRAIFSWWRYRNDGWMRHFKVTNV